MSEALFRRALAVVMEHEGGFVNDPADPGGATQWGVSLRFLRSLGTAVGDVDGDGDIDEADVRLLTIDRAAQIYRSHWWDRFGYAGLPPDLAVKLFDLAVNMGAGMAHRCAQRAARSVGHALTDDGVLGPQSRALFARLDGSGLEGLLPALRSEAAGRYRALIAANPTLRKFEPGWLNRAYF